MVSEPSIRGNSSAEMVWGRIGGGSWDRRADSSSGGVSGGATHHLLGEMPSHQKAATGGILRITVSHVLYPVTKEVLHQVLEAYGVEQMSMFERVNQVEAMVQLLSWQGAERARDALHGRCIYDRCCFLDVQLVQPTTEPASTKMARRDAVASVCAPEVVVEATCSSPPDKPSASTDEPKSEPLSPPTMDWDWEAMSDEQKDRCLRMVTKLNETMRTRLEQSTPSPTLGNAQATSTVANWDHVVATAVPTVDVALNPGTPNGGTTTCSDLDTDRRSYVFGEDVGFGGVFRCTTGCGFCVLEGLAAGVPDAKRMLHEKAKPVAFYMTRKLPRTCFQCTPCPFVQCNNHEVFEQLVFEFLVPDKKKPHPGGSYCKLGVFGSGAEPTFLLLKILSVHALQRPWDPGGQDIDIASVHGIKTKENAGPTPPTSTGVQVINSECSDSGLINCTNYSLETANTSGGQLLGRSAPSPGTTETPNFENVSTPPMPYANSPRPLPSTPQAKHGSEVDAPVHFLHKHSWRNYGLVTARSEVFLVMIAASVIYCGAKKVGTVRPWTTGLSGQLQRAFVTGVPALKRSELEADCEEFSNIIGSTASCMLYKGTLSSGVEIAVVSSLIASGKDWSKECESQYRKKITSLSKVSHKNFMNLLSYCEEEHPFTRAVLFEYAPNGTLFEHLHVREAENLDWMTRLRISMGIAYCLEHMHQPNPPVVPKNFNSTSIYLTDDFAAKVSDLDFWNDTESNSATDDPTMSEIDSIVHQYGIILLEILTGRVPFSEEDGPLEQWVSRYFEGKMPLAVLIDSSLSSFPEEPARALCMVARFCIDPDPNERPKMAQVAARMKEITALGPEGATPKVSPLWWAELEIMSSQAS